jgi:hypothetical protein
MQGKKASHVRSHTIAQRQLGRGWLGGQLHSPSPETLQPAWRPPSSDQSLIKSSTTHDTSQIEPRRLFFPNRPASPRSRVGGIHRLSPALPSTSPVMGNEHYHSGMASPPPGYPPPYGSSPQMPPHQLQPYPPPQQQQQQHPAAGFYSTPLSPPPAFSSPSATYVSPQSTGGGPAYPAYPMAAPYYSGMTSPGGGKSYATASSAPAAPAVQAQRPSRKGAVVAGAAAGGAAGGCCGCCAACCLCCTVM